MMEGEKSKVILHKVAILGTPRAGKTTLMVRLSKGLVDPAIKSTRGVDFHVVSVMKSFIKLQIWDLAGQEHFRNAAIFDDMVLGASAFIFCYDANDPSSIRDIDGWIEVAQHHPRFKDTVKYLVGTKADAIQTAEQLGLSKLVSKYVDNPDLKFKHIIVSAHHDINITELFDELTEDLKKLKV